MGTLKLQLILLSTEGIGVNKLLGTQRDNSDEDYENTIVHLPLYKNLFNFNRFQKSKIYSEVTQSLDAALTRLSQIWDDIGIMAEERSKRSKVSRPYFFI